MHRDQTLTTAFNRTYADRKDVPYYRSPVFLLCCRQASAFSMLNKVFENKCFFKRQIGLYCWFHCLISENNFRYHIIISDVRNYFLIAGIHSDFMISEIRTIFWYQKMIFWYKRNQFDQFQKLISDIKKSFPDIRKPFSDIRKPFSDIIKS